MLIRTKLIVIFSIFMLFVLLVASYLFWQLNKTTNYLNSTIPETVNNIAETSRLDGFAQLIRYYDEVLTQSARNYAYSGDKRWENRYNEYVPKLDKIINNAIEFGDQQEKDIFSSIDSSNQALIKMEEQAFSVANQGNLNAAQTILNSNEYEKEKEAYKNGLNKYMDSRSTKYDEALSVSSDIINNITSKTISSSLAMKWLLILFIFFIVVLLFIAYSILIITIIKPLEKIKNATLSISHGDYTKKIEISQKGEIRDLAESYNKMAAEIKKTRENIEKKVFERTESLEKMNRLMIGRELKMVELKKELEGLKSNNISKSSDKQKTWKEKFSDAINLEEAVIIKLEDYYKNSIIKSKLPDKEKDLLIKKIEILVDESQKHKKNLEEIIKYEK